MYGSYAGRRERLACAVSAVGALAVLLGGCFGTAEPRKDTPSATPKPTPSPLATADGPYWVNPDSSAARQITAWQQEGGRDNDAKLLERIARQPTAEWIGTDNPAAQTRGYTEAAARTGRSAVLVAYNIPHRDCGQYSKGGAADGDTYRAWVDEVAEGIGGRSALVILEPDAITHVVDGCTPAEFHDERYALLSYAIEKLKQRPNTTVYLDAGNAGWVEDPSRLVEPLRLAGVNRADGFALNTSNFYTTGSNAKYGKELSGLLGGKHFVIDTSRNANGPVRGAEGDEAWCNPPGRGLGEPPTRETGDELVDAYLWIKTPGDSDGECKGGPKAGEWWPEYALELARNAESP